MNKDWLDIDVLEDYLDGKLDAKTMNRIEREALEDPFVAEALAGLSASPKRSLASISLLQKQLQNRISEHQITKKRTVITWHRLSIASAAALLFITAGIVYWMNQVNYQKAANQPKQVEVALAPVAADEAETITAPESATVSSSQLPIPQVDAIAQNRKVKSLSTQPDLAKSAVLMAMSLTTVPDSSLVSGRVIDERTGEPLVGAYISGRNKQGVLRVLATADKNGDFAFKKDSALVKDEVNVSYVSYDTKTLPIKPNESLAISLKETSNTLSEEVIVRGYVNRAGEETTGSSFIVSGKQVKDVPVANVDQVLQGKVAGLNIQNNTGAPGKPGSAKTTGTAIPSQGWDHYYMYLAANSKFKSEPRIGKSVELTFKVNDKGIPHEIRVVKGIEKKYNDEAIRLVEQGPKWSPIVPANGLMTLTVNF